MFEFNELYTALQQDRGIYDLPNDNLFAQVPPPSAPAPAPAPDTAAFTNDQWAEYLRPLQEFTGTIGYRAPAGDVPADLMADNLETLNAEVPADYKVDAAAEAEPQPCADADLFAAQDAETQDAEVSPEMDVDAPGEEEPQDIAVDPQLHNDEVPSSDRISFTCAEYKVSFRLFAKPDEQLPSTDTGSSTDTGAKALEKPAPKTAADLTGMKLPFARVQFAESKPTPSANNGAQAQEKPAPKTASDLTGMKLPFAPVQHAESQSSTPSIHRAAEALDTPVQMPAPDHVEEPLPDYEDVSDDVDIVDAPAFNNELVLAISPAPKAPKSMNADIDPALDGLPSVEAQADIFLYRQAAKTNTTLPGNVCIPQNNIWNGESMQRQMNGMFHSSSAGNTYTPQGNMNGMAPQAYMNPQIPVLNNPTQQTGNMGMQNYGNINGMGMQGSTNYQGPLANNFNLPFRPAANVRMQNRVDVNGTGNTIIMHGQEPHLYDAGFNPALNPYMPIPNQASVNGMQQQFGMQPQAQNFVQPGFQASNPLNPNGGIQNGHPLAGNYDPRYAPVGYEAHPNGVYQNGHPPMLNAATTQTPAINGMFRHQPFQPVGQAGSAATVNGAMNANAPAPILNAPTTQTSTINGVVQSPPDESPQHYRRFPSRPNSKPGAPVYVCCLNCGVHVKPFGVRCAGCQQRRLSAAWLETRYCIVGDCNTLLSFGTDRIFCDGHHAEKPQYTEEEKAQFVTEGICNNCRKVDAKNGVTCTPCRTFKNGNYKVRNDDAKSKGLCTSCGEENPSEFNKCDACREKDNVKRRKRPSAERDNEGPQKRARRA